MAQDAPEAAADPVPSDVPAVALLSGGLDSAVASAIARRRGRTLHALSFDYRQRHRAELRAAERVARSLGAASHTIVPIDLTRIGGSALTSDMAVPKDHDPSAPGVPVTYVPARNLIFLSVAAALAEVAGAGEVWIGVNAIDYSGYPDCRPEFIRAFEQAANLGTKAGAEDGRPLRVMAPLSAMSKAEIVTAGVELGVDLSLTHSCYDPPDDEGTHCGRCDACQLRRRGFEEAGAADPTRYAS
jgi:7-cyano-7-deazaguanine synthase